MGDDTPGLVDYKKAGYQTMRSKPVNSTHHGFYFLQFLLPDSYTAFPPSVLDSAVELSADTESVLPS